MADMKFKFIIRKLLKKLNEILIYNNCPILLTLLFLFTLVECTPTESKLPKNCRKEHDFEPNFLFVPDPFLYHDVFCKLALRFGPLLYFSKCGIFALGSKTIQY